MSDEEFVVESQLPPGISRVAEAIYKGFAFRLMTTTEARENMRLAGFVLGDDRALDPEAVAPLPPLDGDDGSPGFDDDGGDVPEVEEAA